MYHLTFHIHQPGIRATHRRKQCITLISFIFIVYCDTFIFTFSHSTSLLKPFLITYNLIFLIFPLLFLYPAGVLPFQWYFLNPASMQALLPRQQYYWFWHLKSDSQFHI